MKRERKPNGYWTLERCKAEATKYDSIHQWNKANGSSYNTALKKGWVEQCTQHMVPTQKPTGYWTLDRCKQSAAKYNSKSEWGKAEHSAINAARKKGWLEQCCSHMQRPVVHNKKWTLKALLESAKKHKTIRDWREAEPTAYNTALRAGYIEQCTAHMQRLRKDKGCWSLESCLESAQKYSTIRDWRAADNGAVSAARRYGWYDRCVAHMRPLGHKYKRAIYAFEFADNTAYVGLSADPAKRKRHHLKHPSNPGIKEHIALGTPYTFKVFDGWYSRDIAGAAEQATLDEYVSNGWVLLNVAKTGSLGGNYIKWTYEECLASAAKHTSLTEWAKGPEASAYVAANKNGWLEDCRAHMELLCKPNGYWAIKENCLDAAQLCKTPTEFAKQYSGAWNAAKAKNWLDECYAHMVDVRKPKGYWTLELCRESAAKYNSKAGWKKADPAAVNAAHKNGWIDQCCAHMARPKNWRLKWTLETCKESAAKYKTKPEWKKAEQGAYNAAYTNGWAEECCSHMVKPPAYNKKWTLETCKKSAAKYKTKSEWQNNELGAYTAARRNGWLAECCCHMCSLQKPAGYWTLARCMESAAKFTKVSHWKAAEPSAYGKARKNGWLEEIRTVFNL